MFLARLRSGADNGGGRWRVAIRTCGGSTTGRLATLGIAFAVLLAVALLIAVRTSRVGRLVEAVCEAMAGCN